MAYGPITSFIPGALDPTSVQDILAEQVQGRVVQSLPSSLTSYVDLEVLKSGASDAIGTAFSAASGGVAASIATGPLAIAAAAVKIAQAVNKAMNGFAAAFEADLGEQFSDCLEDISIDLVGKARGNMLAEFRPSDSKPTLKRAQAKTSTYKKDGYTDLAGLRGQFKKGYVIGVRRPGRSDYIVATVPVLVFTGVGIFGETVPRSMYDVNGKSICCLTEKLGWTNENRWHPFGFDATTGVTAPFPQWAMLAADLINANPSPPVRSRTIVCPGLAPSWGPYGQQLPIGPTLAAYHAAMLRRPPPDLDFVAECIANDTLMRQNPAGTGIIDLLWAREDMARRPEGKTIGLKPRGSQWGGPFWDKVGGEPPSKPAKPPRQQTTGGLPNLNDLGKFAAPPGGGGGAGAGLLGIAALGAGAAWAISRRRKRELT